MQQSSALSPPSSLASGPTHSMKMETLSSNTSISQLEWQNLVLQQSNLVEQQTKIFQQLMDKNDSLAAEVDNTAKYFDDSRRETEMWKRAYLKEQQENERAKGDVEKLRAQLADFEYQKDRNPVVLALIDGDGYIFNDKLLKHGVDGGREAAQILAENIMAHVSKEEKCARVQIWTHVFFNLHGLKNTLVGCEICTGAEFDAFVMGFSQANPRFTIYDAHTGKEAADAKIKAYLQTWARFPQTVKIYFGGAHDNGYHPTLAELQNEGLLEKIILLQGYQQMAVEIRSFHLPTLRIEDLFRPHKLQVPGKTPAGKLVSPLPFALSSPPSPPSSTSPSPKISYTNVVSSHSSSYTNAVSSHPSSYTNAVSSQPSSYTNAVTSHPTLKPNPSSIISATSSKRRFPNPNVEIHRNVPPICNMFYLAKCSRAAECKYSHDYILNDQHYEMLRENARKYPCPYLNLDSPCPFGEQCTQGHKCPHGPQCFYRKVNKCWFKGKGMHQ